MAGYCKGPAGISADNRAHQYMSGLTSVPRPGFNSTGREVTLKLNAYPIEQFPTRDVYQYDVSTLHDFSLKSRPTPFNRLQSLRKIPLST